MEIINTDILIIGAGVLGCFAARALSRYDINTTVLEKREDVCTGISKSNMGIVYAGYDMKPGSLKAKMTVEGNASFEKLCNYLSVPFQRTGSLMISYGEKGTERLQKKYEDGIKNKVPGLKLISGKEAEQMAPYLKKGIVRALYSETTGIVNPWKLGIAAYENAMSNGVNFIFEEEVKKINGNPGQLSVITEKAFYRAKAVINCGGIVSDRIRQMINPGKDSEGPYPRIRNEITAADYLVFDEGTGYLTDKVIFVESEDKKSSYQIIPSFNDNILIGPSKEKWNGIFDDGTTEEGILKLVAFSHEMLPELDENSLISQFGGLRPNPFDAEDAAHKLNDLVILEDYGVISLIGVKTPGITVSEMLGEHVALMALDIVKKAYNGLFITEKSNYQPIRKKPLYEDNDGKFRKEDSYVCRCRKVTEQMVRTAIRSGATTVNGVRRRTGAGMGRCQGSYCEHKIIDLLSEELNIPKECITKNGTGGELLFGKPLVK